MKCYECKKEFSTEIDPYVYINCRNYPLAPSSSAWLVSFHIECFKAIAGTEYLDMMNDPQPSTISAQEKRNQLILSQKAKLLNQKLQLRTLKKDAHKLSIEGCYTCGKGIMVGGLCDKCGEGFEE